MALQTMKKTDYLRNHPQTLRKLLLTFNIKQNLKNKDEIISIIMAQFGCTKKEAIALNNLSVKLMQEQENAKESMDRLAESTFSALQKGVDEEILSGILSEPIVGLLQTHCLIKRAQAEQDPTKLAVYTARRELFLDYLYQRSFSATSDQKLWFDIQYTKTMGSTLADEIDRITNKETRQAQKPVQYKK